MAGRHGMDGTRRRAAGFTMIELLIAGLLSALVLLSVYFVFIGNTTQYYRQEQIVQMQESMRFALEYLKNDLRNAGRLGVMRGADPGRDPRLCTARPALAAVTLCEGAEPDLARLRVNGNELLPDRVRLVGDSGGGVMLRTAQVRPDRIVLAPELDQPTADARALVASEARLARLFGEGTRVAVRAPGHANSMDVVEVAGLAFNAGGSVITLGETLCNDAAGVVAPALSFCGGECLVSPVQAIEYAVRPDPDDNTRTRLVRRTLPGDANTTQCGAQPAPVEELVMAELAVDLQVWGQYASDALVPTLPADPDPTDARGNLLDRDEETLLRDEIDRVRAFEVMLAVRTPREDPDFRVAPGRAVAPDERVAVDRTWFELDPVPGTGLARVATSTATVEAVNLVPGL